MMHFGFQIPEASPVTGVLQPTLFPSDVARCTLLVCGHRNHRYPVTVTVASTPVNAAHRQEDMAPFEEQASQVLILINDFVQGWML